MSDLDRPEFNLVEELRTIIEWSRDGRGQHNFIRLKISEFDPDIEQLLKQNNYTIITFPSLDEDNRQKLEEFLINAQSYMDQRMPSGKIAVIIYPAAWEQIMVNQHTHDMWTENGPYTITLEQ